MQPQPHKKHKKTVQWGQVRVREYVRMLSTGGIPEGEPGCKFPLGISDFVVVRDVAGEILHGVDVRAGSTLPPAAMGLASATAENGASAEAAAQKSAEVAINYGLDQSARATPLEAVAAQMNSDGAGATNSHRLKIGERVIGTVESYDAAVQEEKANRITDMMKGKGKKGLSTAVVAALSAKGPTQWHCDEKERQRKLAVNPCLMRGQVMQAEADRLSAEYSAICKHRAESNTGCRCGVLSADELQSCKKEDLMRECKLRGLAVTGGKKALVDRLAQHSKKHLGCTSYMHALLDKLEADATRAGAQYASINQSSGSAEKSSSATGSVSGGSGTILKGSGTPPHKVEGISALSDVSGAGAAADSPMSSASSSSSTTSIHSIGETREEEVNARLARLLGSVPKGMQLPEDPRQRKAFVRAFLLSDDLRETAVDGAEASNDNAPEPSLAAKLLLCPCQAEGVGCHYNTCACDPDLCDNRHLWDPSSAVYADRLFELHRAAVHFLNASWMVAHEQEEELADAQAQAAAVGKTPVASTSTVVSSSAYLHLPGGQRFEIPGGMNSDGPFFNAEQVVWTMKLVEQLVAIDEEEDGEGGDEEDGRNGSAHIHSSLCDHGHDQGDDDDGLSAGGTGDRGTAGKEEEEDGGKGAGRGRKRGRARGTAGAGTAAGMTYGVSELEWGLLHAIYSKAQIAAACGGGMAASGGNIAGMDRSSCPVSSAADGVFSVWANVQRMPSLTLARLSSKPVRTAMDGWLTSLSWLQIVHTSAVGRLGACLQAVADGAGGSADESQTGPENTQDAATLVTRMRAHFSPPDGAALLRCLMRAITQDAITASASVANSAESTVTVHPASSFNEEARARMFSMMAANGIGGDGKTPAHKPAPAGAPGIQGELEEENEVAARAPAKRARVDNQ